MNKMIGTGKIIVSDESMVYKNKMDAEKSLIEYQKKLIPHRYCVLLEREGGWVIGKTNIGEEIIFGCSNWNKVFKK